ncbi:MAG: tRNA (adenosine(37)-N6)-threonylcarbamoyltransferase complex ATPase subunit type 1 TsaE [Pseudomonadota bacterium]
MTLDRLDLHSHSPDDTARFAAALAPLLDAGDTVLLEGPIGAGKSHFTRSAILQILSVPEDIPSPTYTIVQTYLSPKAEVWHADLYRLGNAGEVHEIGLWAAFEDAICFVEWPDRLGTQAPTSALTVTLSPQAEEEDRVLSFSWTDPRWRTRLEGIFDA